jgi:hypothetical protein
MEGLEEMMDEDQIVEDQFIDAIHDGEAAVDSGALEEAISTAKSLMEDLGDTGLKAQAAEQIRTLEARLPGMRA